MSRVWALCRLLTTAVLHGAAMLWRVAPCAGRAGFWLLTPGHGCAVRPGRAAVADGGPDGPAPVAQP